MMRWRSGEFARWMLVGVAVVAAATMVGCKPQSAEDVKTPQLPVTTQGDMSLVTVDKPEQFPLVGADTFTDHSTLTVTGAVSPDISREIPVISMANGRVVEIKARLDDAVRKGQLLMKVQSNDSTAAFDAYLKAVNDERTSNKAYLRAKELYDHGAISQAMLEQAEGAEKDATTDLKATEETLTTLGLDKDHPSPVVNVYAPISGVIVQQNVTQAAAAGATLAGSVNAFVIADMTHLWVLCDVFENDIPKLQVGQEARISLSAYPDKKLMGRISDVGPVLDPQLRTAKVRIEVANPGILKIGMFVTATLESRKAEQLVEVPAPSVLHLHDRDWVFVPADGNKFRRVEVKAGRMNGDKQVVLSGILAGQKVVSNVLQLESTLEAQ